MRQGIAATFVLTLFVAPVSAQEPTLADVSIPTPEAAAAGANDGAMDLRTAGMTGARVSITDQHDDRVFVAIDVPNGRHAGGFTPCVVLVDAGAMHVQTAHVARIVELETGVDREIEVDPGWDGVATRPHGRHLDERVIAPTLDASGRVGGQGAITVRF